MTEMASSETSFPTPGENAGEAQAVLNNFWPSTLDEIKRLSQTEFRIQELPLARIKKIMKLDENVKMISAEAPALFARAAEIFINELTLRAWIHTEDNKRRTLQRNDIALAISKYDQFDFLIDIVPRDELKPAKRTEENAPRTSMMPDQVQYYFQLAQQHQAALQQQQQPQAAAGQVIQQPIQLQVTGGTSAPASNVQTITIQSPDGQPQVLQIQQATPTVAQQSQPQTTQASVVTQQQPQVVTQVASQPATAQQPQTQVYTQIVSENGEVQNIPIQLTPAQIQNITLQMQGKQPGQPIVIQTQPQGQDQQAGTTPPLFQIPLSSVTGGQVFVQQANEESTDGQENTS